MLKWVTVKWISRVYWGKVLLIGVIFTVISMVVRQIEMIWTLRYYMMPQYNGVWSRLMMPKAGPPPPEFFIMSTIITFTTGVCLTLIYYYLREYLPKGFWKRASYFADVMVATSFVFFTLPTIVLFNVPYALVGAWFFSTFIVLFLSAIVIVKIVN